MTQMRCAGCGKAIADANEAATCPHCGRPLQAPRTEPPRPAQAARERSALDREFELLCLMDDMF